MAYAERTEVSVEKTETELKAMLRRAGATGIGILEEKSSVILVFEMQARRIVFRLPMPSRDDKDFRKTESGSARSAAKQHAAWEQACRSRWRSLFLCLKAKLESIASNIETFEDAFLAHIMLPGGDTVGEVVKPRIAQEYQNPTGIPLIPDLRDRP